LYKITQIPILYYTNNDGSNNFINNFEIFKLIKKDLKNKLLTKFDKTVWTNCKLIDIGKLKIKNMCYIRNNLKLIGNMFPTNDKLF